MFQLVQFTYSFYAIPGSCICCVLCMSREVWHCQLIRTAQLILAPREPDLEADCTCPEHFAGAFEKGFNRYPLNGPDCQYM